MNIPYILVTFETSQLPMGWLKARALIEHTMHIGHIRDVPTAYGLVKGYSSIEHTSHIGHIRDVPTAYGLVKGYRAP